MIEVTIHKGHTSSVIKDHARHHIVRHIIDKYLYQLRDMTFDKRLKRYVVDKCYYRFSKQMMVAVLPNCVIDAFINDLKLRQISHKVEIIPDPPVRTVNFNIKPQWTDKPGQSEMITFLMEYDQPMRCLAMQTGGGKSYCSIKAAILKKVPFLIITSGLVEQWCNYLSDYTDLQNEDIYVIRDAKSIVKLINMEYKPTAFVASLETLRNFAQEKPGYENLGMSLPQLVHHFGIGIKIIDECHDNFHAITSIDLSVSIPINIYLSATFIRNNPSTKKIFDMIFPPNRRYGSGAYVKYVDIKMFEYNSPVPDKLFSLGGFYAHYRYEDYIFKKPARAHWWIVNILKRILDQRFISIRKPHQGTLVLMFKVEHIKTTIDKLRELYPKLTVESYVGDDPEENLKADIIVSTIGSAGQGLDVPDLVHLLNTVSIAAEGKVLQILGRLRKLKDGSQVYLSDVHNSACEAHKKHKDEREIVYITRSKTFSKQLL